MAYKRTHGHVDVPVNNTSKNEYCRLGRWVATLRATRQRLEQKERQRRDNPEGATMEEEKKKRGEYLTAGRIKVRLCGWREEFIFASLLIL